MTSVIKQRLAASPRWFREILDEVSDRHGVYPCEIMSDSRQSHVARARHEAIYLVKRRRFRMNVASIGELFNVHQSSVTYAIARHHAVTGAGKILSSAKAEGLRRAA